MHMHGITHLTLRGTSQFIGGHKFQYLTTGVQYPVLCCKAFLLTIKDDRGQELKITCSALREFFKPHFA